MSAVFGRRKHHPGKTVFDMHSRMAEEGMAMLAPANSGQVDVDGISTINCCEEIEKSHKSESKSCVRTNVLGVGISATNMDDALLLSDRLIRSNGKGYVCITGVHGVIEAQSDDAFRLILNRSFMTTPDGMPMVWVGRFEGHKEMRRVYGPDYMMKMCRLSVGQKYRHFLYGGNVGVAERLAMELRKKFRA